MASLLRIKRQTTQNDYPSQITIASSNTSTKCIITIAAATGRKRTVFEYHKCYQLYTKPSERPD